MLDLLLPRRCVLCHHPGGGLCGPCTATLPPAPELAPPPGFSSCGSLLAYEGTTRQVVAALKYTNHRDAVGLLGAAMAQLVTAPVDVVTWAPTSAARRRQRGYDQARALAVAVARDLRVRCAGSLVRTAGGAQTGLDRAHRLDGPRYECARPPGRRVLLVDDVRTTGATLSAAGDALLDAGVGQVHGLTLAVRP
jgi:predicted amidophosphoribosyltransferase